MKGLHRWLKEEIKPASVPVNFCTVCVHDALGAMVQVNTHSMGNVLGTLGHMANPN